MLNADLFSLSLNGGGWPSINKTKILNEAGISPFAQPNLLIAVDPSSTPQFFIVLAGNSLTKLKTSQPLIRSQV